jgi:hypothetical protein
MNRDSFADESEADTAIDTIVIKAGKEILVLEGTFSDEHGDSEVIEWEIDPNEAFTDVKVGKLVAAAGILPFWIDPSDDRWAAEQFKEQYPFWTGHINGSGTINARGTKSYPGDPDDEPILKIDLGREVVYIYLRSMVGIVETETGNTLITRMD